MKGRASKSFSRRIFGIFAGCALTLIGSAYVVWQRAYAPAQLWMATIEGDTRRMRILLNFGADVNAQFDPDYHFLWGDPDGRDIYGKAYTRRYWRPLATAASAGDTRVVRLLRRQGSRCERKRAGLLWGRRRLF